jgi:hypothetical protein
MILKKAFQYFLTRGILLGLSSLVVDASTGLNKEQVL